jgi:hypothetical protein
MHPSSHGDERQGAAVWTAKTRDMAHDADRFYLGTVDLLALLAYQPGF